MSKILIKRAAIALLIAALGACANVQQGVRHAVDVVASTLPDAPSAQERVHTAMDLLERGDQDRARGILQAALRQEPGNTAARRLLDQIDRDPHTLLGAHSQAYTVRAGDTMSGLAERFVGDPLMFYALARYNHLTPNQLAAGQTIQVPARNRTGAAALRTVSAPASAGTPTVPTPASTLATTQASARANQLRLQGLERLNAGDPNGAVGLLRQAQSLDSSNSAIQGDLTRALRIQASLSAH